jgi:hypothetical protein
MITVHAVFNSIAIHEGYMDPTCTNCGKIIPVRPNVKSQTYCGQNSCQKARKRKWQQAKLKSDPDYYRNQVDAQAAWCRRHPDYWKKYRERKPAYAEQNRLLQRKRNQRRRLKAASGMIAKMDACNFEKSLKNKPFGTYQIIPVGQDGVIAKMDTWIVEIREITNDSGGRVVSR